MNQNKRKFPTTFTSQLMMLMLFVSETTRFQKEWLSLMRY